MMVHAGVWRSVASPSVMKQVVVVMTVVMCGVLILLHHTTTTTTTPNTTLQTQAPGAVAEDPTWWRDFLCGPHKQEGEDQLPLKVLFRDVTPVKKDRNVFLMQTDCSSHPKYRAWCAVESWANRNPGLDVWFILTSLTLDDSDRLPHLLLRRYPNLKVVGIDLDLIFNNTPVRDLFMSRKWTVEETWPPEVLSNMLRVLVLWHWGGIYSDTDILAINAFTLPLNAVGFDSHALIGSALYAFHAAHPVLWALMEDINREFIAGVWGIVGPDAITRVMKKECGMEDTQAMMQKSPLKCNNVTIYPHPVFFPVHWLNFQSLLNDGTGANFTQAFSTSILLHMWNKFTKHSVVKAGRGSIYDVTASKFCPVTYSRATLRSHVF